MSVCTHIHFCHHCYLNSSPVVFVMTFCNCTSSSIYTTAIQEVQLWKNWIQIAIESPMSSNKYVNFLCYNWVWIISSYLCSFGKWECSELSQDIVWNWVFMVGGDAMLWQQGYQYFRGTCCIQTCTLETDITLVRTVSIIQSDHHDARTREDAKRTWLTSKDGWGLTRHFVCSFCKQFIACALGMVVKSAIILYPNHIISVHTCWLFAQGLASHVCPPVTASKCQVQNCGTNLFKLDIVQY